MSSMYTYHMLYLLVGLNQTVYRAHTIGLAGGNKTLLSFISMPYKQFDLIRLDSYEHFLLFGISCYVSLSLSICN